MSSKPPWEWVNGDPLRSMQFAFLAGITWGVTIALLAWFEVALFSSVSPLHGTDFRLAQNLLYALLALSVVNGVIGFYLPRRIPVIGSIGISPIGLRLKILIAGRTVYWGELKRIGPDWIDVSPGLGTQRYRLTQGQTQRIRSFLQPH
jgi:hypothetical protein